MAYETLYEMLDQTSVNSFIIYNLLKDNPEKCRKDYIRELTIALIKPFLTHPLAFSTLRTVLRTQIESFIDYTDIPENQDSRNLLTDNKMAKPTRCSLCPSTLDRKTMYKCLKCDKPMCKHHTAKICCEYFM
jgi:hypothetical protein